eukprot:TRINITY_DN13571_c0_g2_i4.p1 TRINITY_DN13571_c0_g2~~TRINITY_DN13571_c0_g2_i4.p1  ORF type:complete len:250 (+),score=-26.50 TRINITY_DN13571_c0_g2_i4:543-1292(+)
MLAHTFGNTLFERLKQSVLVVFQLLSLNFLYWKQNQIVQNFGQLYLSTFYFSWSLQNQNHFYRNSLLNCKLKVTIVTVKLFFQKVIKNRLCNNLCCMQLISAIIIESWFMLDNIYVRFCAVKQIVVFHSNFLLGLSNVMRIIFLELIVQVKISSILSKFILPVTKLYRQIWRQRHYNKIVLSFFRTIFLHAEFFSVYIGQRLRVQINKKNNYLTFQVLLIQNTMFGIITVFPRFLEPRSNCYQIINILQ